MIQWIILYGITICDNHNIAISSLCNDIIHNDSEHLLSSSFLPTLKSFIYILLFNPHVSPLGHIFFLLHFLVKARMLQEHQLVSCCCCNKLLQTQMSKQQGFITWQFWRFEVPNGLHWAKVEVSAGLCSFQRLKGKIHFLPFSSF